MQTIKQFSKIVDYHTGLVTLLALVVVFLCRQLNFLVDLPTTLIGIAVVFLLVFSIISAYKRRGVCQPEGARRRAAVCPS